MDDWPLILLRFLHYAVLLGLFGAITYRLAGLRWLSAAAQPERVDRALLSFALLAPFVSGALFLLSIAAMMGQPIWLIEWSTVEAMISTTSIGWAFAARMALLSGALVALLSRHRSPFALLIAAVFYGFAIASLSWSGHAAALEGGAGRFHRINDTVHLLTAGLWLGAIGWFLILTIRAHRNPDEIPSQRLLSTMHGFAPLGMGLVAAVIITGLINAQMIFGLPNSCAVLITDYGQLLAAKVALVVLMMFCGGRNALIGKRRAAKGTNLESASVSDLANLRTSLAIEITLAVVVIGLVAIVGMMSPTI